MNRKNQRGMKRMLQRPLKKNAKERKERKKERRKRFVGMNYSFLFFIGIGFLAIYFFTESWHKTAVASLWALAALASGAFAGLLFGIQRVRPDETSKTEINNNLAEVSDWLTKIIVGVGLIEL